MATWNTVNLTDIRADRFDAEYFRKDYQDNIDYLESLEAVQSNCQSRAQHSCIGGRTDEHISFPRYTCSGTVSVLCRYCRSITGLSYQYGYGIHISILYV